MVEMKPVESKTLNLDEREVRAVIAALMAEESWGS
jgi:hypothetical protein